VLLRTDRGVRMQQHKRINGKEVLADIRSGMTEFDLKAKYQLSSKGLEKLFRRLMDTRLIDRLELYQRFPVYKKSMESLGERSQPRARLSVPVLAYDINSSAIGVIRDISMNGLRIAGLKSQAGDVRTFQIPVDMFINTDPLLVIAKCRWMKLRDGMHKHAIAGFEVINISERDSSVLRTFLDFLLLSRSGEWQALE